MRTITRFSVFAVFLALVVTLIYWQGLDGPFLFDDKPALTSNELVKISGNTFDQWRVAALSSESGPLRRPIAMLSFAANHVVAGDFSPTQLKAVNLALHMAIAAVLFAFFLAVLDLLEIGVDQGTRNLLALAGAAIWLLHPLNVSTVLYSVQRMAQLATFFVLIGLLVFVRYRRRWMTVGAGMGEVFAAGLWLILLCVLAALSKENGALLPWLILVLEVCLFRGIWAGQQNRYLQPAGWILLSLPLLLGVAIYVFSPETLAVGYSGREFTLEQRVLTQGRLLWRYLGWICFPNINDMGFQHDDIPLSTGFLLPYTTAIALGAWLSLLFVAIAMRRRYPLLLLATLFFLVGHSMESSVLPLEMVYEHRNYLPGTMVCLALAALIIVPASRSKKIGVFYPVSGVLAVLCLLLFIRVQTWSDELTLSRVNLAQHDQSSRSNYFYANSLLRHFRRAEQLNLDEQEKTEALLLSRHYFERMHQTGNRDVAALVMLFYLDSHYFTSLQAQVDWLDKLEELLSTRVLQSSDWNALSTLFEIFSSGADVTSESRVLGLLDQLSARYPGSVNVLRYRYQYLASREVEPSEILAVLQQAQLLAPRATWVYYAVLGEYASSNNVAGMYDYARLWLLYDRPRYGIHQLKGLFSDSDTIPGASHD